MLTDKQMEMIENDSANLDDMKRRIRDAARADLLKELATEARVSCRTCQYFNGQRQRLCWLKYRFLSGKEANVDRSKGKHFCSHWSAHVKLVLYII